MGTMILLVASAAAVITPALAEGRNGRGLDSAYVADNRAPYATFGHRDGADSRESRRDGERARDTRQRNQRDRHDRDEWRARSERGRRW